MRRLLTAAMAVGVLGAAGCGSDPKPPGPPTETAIQADKAAQKTVEEEERGTPYKPKR